MPKSQLYSLQEFNVIKTMNQSYICVSAGYSSKYVYDLNIYLPKDNLSQREMHKAKYLFINWKHIFPTGPTNHGFTNLIEHEL